MVEAAQVLRRRLPQRLWKLVHRKAGRIGGTDAMLHKVQIEGGVFAVGKHRIPDLIAPRKINIRFRGIGL